MRIVITGASGFLGSAVYKALSACGYDAIGVSRRDMPGLTHVASYRDAPAGDMLVHLAQANDRAWVNAHEAQYQEEATASLSSLLAKKYRYCLYASSAALYGDAHAWPRRADEAVTPTDGYTRIKYESELAVLDAGGTAVRFSNLYGLGMSQNNVVSTILHQLPHRGPMMLHDISPIRDFLWVEDAAAAIGKMIQNPHSGVFNIGTSVGTSIQDLAQMALATAGQEGRSIISRITHSRPSTLTVDITPTIAAFQWQPSMLLAGGLSQLIPVRVVHA